MLFAFAAGELPATNMTVPPGVEMMSVRLWSLMHTGMESHLAAFVLLLSIVLSSFFAGLSLLGAAVLRRFVTGSRMIE
jgi:iron(III) transport system permease protein